ncbi:hypothetical protein D4Z93_00585 [Clostridium fermenticellae]|uniref:Uncharacterized protein n=1 Tax=Clostridium fermenticellae TaxID=2068654 RepID=A0A386H0H1_9CLOT|nr:hypothetical protein [Clostridium fermenticellae]AYD39138.1 hypothetical protein D4Z93_00585 [Clostridium fermenticellae]
MIGKVIDMNISEAFVALQDNRTIQIGLAHLPSNCTIGSTVNINPTLCNMKNDNDNHILKGELS